MLWVFGDITIQIHAVRDDTDRKTVAKTRNQSKHDTDSRHSFDWTSHSQVVAHGCRLTPDVSLVNVEALASRQDEQINVQLQEFQTPKQSGEWVLGPKASDKKKQKGFGNDTKYPWITSNIWPKLAFRIEPSGQDETYRCPCLSASTDEKALAIQHFMFELISIPYPTKLCFEMSWAF